MCIVREGPAVVGVVPFSLTSGWIRGVPARIADLSTNVASYHPELIGTLAAETLLELTFSGREVAEWDVLRINNIPDAGHMAAGVRAWVSRHGYRATVTPGEHSPYVPVQGDWVSFVQSRPKKFRANINRMLRRPSEYGESVMVWFRSEADTDELLRMMLLVERASWKAREGISIADRPSEVDYYRQLLPLLSSKKWLFANVLKLNDQPVAYVLCCLAGGWCGQMKTSFVPDARDCGGAVITASIMQAHESGATEYDFLGNADPHKLRWADAIRPHSNYLITSGSWRGKLIHGMGRLRAISNRAGRGDISRVDIGS